MDRSKMVGWLTADCLSGFLSRQVALDARVGMLTGGLLLGFAFCRVGTRVLEAAMPVGYVPSGEPHQPPLWLGPPAAVEQQQQHPHCWTDVIGWDG
jgi:hypothetical protein